MNYEWKDPDGNEITVGKVDGRGYIQTDDGLYTAADLPTEPAEVEAFLRAILDATGCRFSWSSIREDFDYRNEHGGGVRVVKRES